MANATGNNPAKSSFYRRSQPQAFGRLDIQVCFTTLGLKSSFVATAG